MSYPVDRTRTSSGIAHLSVRDQEAYVTFTQIDTTSNEQRLILKSQSSKSSSSGLISILYDGAGHNVQVWTYHPTQGWVQYGTNIPVTFANGDQLGARAKPDGTVEIYRNGTLLATRNITSWPFMLMAAMLACGL